MHTLLYYVRRNFYLSCKLHFLILILQLEQIYNAICVSLKIFQNPRNLKRAIYIFYFKFQTKNVTTFWQHTDTASEGRCSFWEHLRIDTKYGWSNTSHLTVSKCRRFKQIFGCRCWSMTTWSLWFFHLWVIRNFFITNEYTIQKTFHLCTASIWIIPKDFKQCWIPC